MMNIAFKQAHSGNYRRAARGKEDIRYLVIHFTANDGDTAKNNADYFARAEISTSAHYFVDENEVWQSVHDADIAWHCGTRGTYFHPYCRNANSIGIELCSRKNGEKFYFMPETVRRAQALTRELMAKYGIPLEKCCAPLRCYAQKLSCAVRRERIRVDSIQAGVTEKGGT